MDKIYSINERRIQFEKLVFSLRLSQQYEAFSLVIGPEWFGVGAPLRLSTPTHSLMQVFKTNLYVKITTASVVKYCKCCRIKAGNGFRDFKRRLVINSPLCVVFKGGNAFSGEFEKNDQGSTFSLVQININKYINIYKYILYILLIFVQFCILHSCKVCF